jgi:hypothetical protein
MTDQELEMVEKRRGHRQPRQRIACTICGKPAVRYYQVKQRKVEYEHRDEPPISEYHYRGKVYKRYRRCYGGSIVKNGLEGIMDGRGRRGRSTK